MPEDSISSIFFEKQEALLCAQHALNMLLQQHMFSAVELAEIARKLDMEENAVLESGHKESQNMNDAGFFSVQVISEALKGFKLDLISILHPGVEDIKANPLLARAFICNRSEHWFVIRKFGQQWFELNSCRNGPLLHTDTYVALFLKQLTDDGYAIFVVQGELPDCAAEHVIEACPVKFMPPKRKDKKEDEKKDDKKETKAFSGSGHRLGGDVTAPIVIDDDDELQEAIRRSLQEQAGPSHSSGGRSGSNDYDLRRAMEMSTEDDSEERSFQMALAMSMQGAETGAEAATTAVSAADEQRLRREAFLKRFD
ncbi:hypothetical protein PFISCL1PPCAC_565 [Pristionchus fissidentatus]|uniref:Ataxin-3 homolog n=1 Tax=Pristionchus fissidentatus TaxID=1538716 RepID=A0AAV5USP4_9BILA|nr:hypothetical protein PFISCL1PPCAC_565 [Pristionchus fissidentatus]